MRRYRVNASVGDLRHGELIEIDDSHTYWQGLIAAKTISLVPEVKPLVPSPGAAKPLERPIEPIAHRFGRSQPAQPEPTHDELAAATSPPQRIEDDLEVREQIREMFSTEPIPTTADVAQHFGVTRSYASKVRRGLL